MRTKIGILIFVLICGLISGCVFGKKKPVVVDPCASAPTECWVGDGKIGVDPNSVPECVELVKCYAWEMRAK